MIPTAAIERYLARKLDSHLWVKHLTHEQLDEAIHALTPRPTFMPKLRLHQKACFLLGVSYPQFCYWLDMGTGKSLLSLTLLAYWFQCGLFKRSLIFVKSDKAFLSWLKQIQQFDVPLPMAALSGSSEQRWQHLHEFREGLALLPYPGAVAMTSCRVPKRKGKKNELVLDPKLVQQLRSWAHGFVLDESTAVGNYGSLTHNLVHQLRKDASVCYALAGRPFGRDPTMLWSQHWVIDRGETLGETLGLFRAAFFNEKDNPHARGARSKYAKIYTFKKSMQLQLSRRAQHRSITYGADECIDLPRVVPIEEFVTFSDEAQAYYQRIVQEVVSGHKQGFRELKNVFLRMRQISSGFIGFKNDETGEKAEVEFQENPKLELLLELLGELPEGRKAVVFYEYTYSGRKIVESLKSLGLKCVWLWSGTKNSSAEQARFEQDPDCTVAVINNKVGNFSLDGLQRVANYSMFYESPVAVIDREQAERRLVRDGQEHCVFQYDLLMKNSRDERIRQFHREGGNLYDALLKNPSEVLLG